MKSFFDMTDDDWVEMDMSAELEADQVEYEKTHKDSISVEIVKEESD